MRAALALLLLLTASSAAAQLSAGFGGVVNNPRATLYDRTVLAYAGGPARLRGRQLQESGFPTGHSIVFTGTPTITVPACTPPCTSNGATITSWDSTGVVFSAVPSSVTGGYTVQVVTPAATSNAVPIDTYSLQRYYLPALSDDNQTAGSRLLVDGFEYGCSSAEPCDMSAAAFSHTQWDSTATKTGTATITNDYNATPWNGDAGNNWAMHVSGSSTDTAYRVKTITGTAEVSAHMEFCPQSRPAAARQILAFRNNAGSADQAFLTFGSDGIVRAYYGSTSNLAGISGALTNGTCYELALLQDASRDTAGCAQVTLYVDGAAVADAELCSLTIANVDRVRLGMIDGPTDAVFDNVVISGGYDRSVAYLRLADLQPTADSAPNAWNRTTPQRSGCANGNNFECINDMAPSGQCATDLTLACDGTDSVAQCGTLTTCKYVDATPVDSIDSDDSAVYATTSASDEEEYTLSDITLGSSPQEFLATGGAVGMTCWMEEQNSNSATKSVCFAVSDGTTARCGTATNINGFGASAYYPITQLYTADSANAAWSQTSVNGLYFRLQNPSAATADTRVRASACLAEVEITKRLPSFIGGNPLPVALAFASNGDLYATGEYSAKIYKVPSGASDGATATTTDIPGPATGMFGYLQTANRTNNSGLAEDMDYVRNGSTDEIWFTQGGAYLQCATVGCVPGNPATPNNGSRVVLYRPSATPQWRCFNAPYANAETTGMYRDSATAVYASNLTGVFAFNPTLFSDAQATCLYDFTTGSAPAPLCGVSDDWTTTACFKQFDSTGICDVTDLVKIGSDLWATCYFSNRVAKLAPATGTWTTYALPFSARSARIWQGSGLIDLGVLPGVFTSASGLLWWGNFASTTIGYGAPSSMVPSQVKIPDLVSGDSVHTVYAKDTDLWVSVGHSALTVASSKMGILDTATTPYGVSVFEPYGTIDPTPGSFGGIAEDPNNSYRLCSTWASADAAAARGVKCFQKQPPPATYTNTPTPTRTQTPTVTNTPVVYENGILHGLVLTGTNTAVRYFQTSLTSNTAEANADVATPFGIQFNRTDVLCASAPGTNVTHTFQQRINRGNVSGASCAIAGASALTCAITGMSQTFTVTGTDGDQFDLTHVKSGAGTASAINCTTATAYKAASGTTEADAILTGGGASVTNAVSTTRYCGPTWGGTGATPNAAWSCGGSSFANAAMLVAAPCTLSGVSIIADSTLPASVTESITVKVRPKTRAPTDAAGDLTTDLSGANALSSSRSELVDTSCTSNCNVVAGDRVVIEDVTGASGTPAARLRRWALACDGQTGQTGQLVAFALANSLASGSTAYGLYNTNSAVGSVAVRAPRAIVARNLYVMVDALSTGGEQKVTLRKHTTDPTQLSNSATDTALTCTTVNSDGSGTGNNWCASGTHCCRLEGTDVTINQGDYYVGAVAGQTGSATTNAFVHVGWEESNSN